MKELRSWFLKSGPALEKQTFVIFSIQHIKAALFIYHKLFHSEGLTQHYIDMTKASCRLLQ